MTFAEKEISTFGGEPIDLYTFNRAGMYWRYTSADENKTIGGFIYESIPISVGNYERSQDSAKNPISIKISKESDFVQQFIVAPPSDLIPVTITKYHETDPDLEVIVVWTGRVINVRFLEKEVTVSCEPIFTSIRRPLLRRVYQVACPYILYGISCKLTNTDFSVDGTITTISGLTITASEWGAYDDDYFTGGYIERTGTLGGAIDKRPILTQTGTAITINLQIVGLSVGETITAYPGCNHNLTTCINKFANNLNFGGFPYMPNKNPMDGTPVF